MLTLTAAPSSAFPVPAGAIELLDLDADAGRAAGAAKVVSLVCDAEMIHERVLLDGVWHDRMLVGDAALVTWVRQG